MLEEINNQIAGSSSSEKTDQEQIADKKQVDLYKYVVMHWKYKVLYEKGEYLKCKTLCNKV